MVPARVTTVFCGSVVEQRGAVNCPGRCLACGSEAIMPVAALLGRPESNMSMAEPALFCAYEVE